MGSDRDGAAERVCRWIGAGDALRHFASYGGTTQSQQHIKPLHWYVACRLVVEGGFHPDEVTPHPPLDVSWNRDELRLAYDPASANGAEATLLGGLKTKDVDVVVSKHGIGPVLAVSCKGMTGAFRNLTNRMEETIGECTNLHITYPALVLGYLFVIRANRPARRPRAAAVAGAPGRRELAANDLALSEAGDPVEGILRFHSALLELTGRTGIRSDGSRYEGIALALVDTGADRAGEILSSFPPAGSPLRIERFFRDLYRAYDERFVYSAPSLSRVTARVAWSPLSPALTGLSGRALDYEARLAVPDPTSG